MVVSIEDNLRLRLEKTVLKPLNKMVLQKG